MVKRTADPLAAEIIMVVMVGRSLPPKSCSGVFESLCGKINFSVRVVGTTGGRSAKAMLALNAIIIRNSMIPNWMIFLYKGKEVRIDSVQNDSREEEKNQPSQ